MSEAGEKADEILQGESDSSRENILRFIRLEFHLAETLSGLLAQTENKRQRKRLRHDIRKAKVSIVHFKKRVGQQSGDQEEIDEYIGKIDSILRESGSSSKAEFMLKRLRHRVKKLRNPRAGKS
jgi:hypothetical protein